MEGASWRLINVFAVEGGKFVGAYCPAQDFVESMLELTRKKLVVESPSVLDCHFARAAADSSRCRDRREAKAATCDACSQAEAGSENR